ncbi:MAG: HNH endonuclease [Archangium sp.]|nr:HNH endonuclease [Archangium sp.]
MGTQVTLLAIVRTDSTFEKVRTRDGSFVWQGKCLHCNTKLVVELDGSAVKRVTIEHIVPQSAGGSNDLLNLALACSRCNNRKGRQHDHKGLSDARAAELIEKLLEKRRARWRDDSDA